MSHEEKLPEELLYVKEQFICGKTEKHPGGVISPHFHDMYEIYMLMSDEIEYMVEGEIYRLKKGDIVITNLKEFHKPIYREKPSARSYIQFKQSFLPGFDDPYFDLYLCFEKRALGQHNHIVSEIVCEHGLDNLFYDIILEAQSDTVYSLPIIKSYITIFLCKLNRILSESGNNIGAQRLKNEKVNELLNYINRNITSKITLDKIEKKLYLNKYHICHIFKEETGFSVNEYITCKRIMLAKNYLLEGIKPVKAAEISGFFDYSNFYKAFVGLVGVSPRQFLKNRNDFIYQGEEQQIPF